LSKEIEAWCGFIEKLPTGEDNVVLTKLLDSCYKYSLAMKEHAPQHKLIILLKLMMQSKNK